MFFNKTENSSETIKWSQEGKTFIIANTEKFIRILPKYFKTKNYSSFVRQLNMYNFHKIKNKEGYHEFQHENFRKGALEDLKLISRKLTEQTEPVLVDTKDQKSIIIENNRLKRQVAELDETLKIVTAQTKLVIDTNKDLIYKIYKSKTENDMQVKRLLFLYFAFITNGDSELLGRIKNEFIKNSGVEIKENELVFSMENITQFVKHLNQQVMLSKNQEDSFIFRLMETFLNYHNEKEPNEENRFSMEQLQLNLNLTQTRQFEEGGAHKKKFGILSIYENDKDDENLSERFRSLPAQSEYNNGSILNFDLENFKMNELSYFSKDPSVRNFETDSYSETGGNSIFLRTPRSEK